MPTDVVMPQMGESIFEGTITKWLKKAGDKVQRDEPLFEISTDKVDAEIPAPASGILQEIKVSEGNTVQVNTIVGVIGDGNGTTAAPAKAAPPPPAPPPPPRRPRPPPPLLLRPRKKFRLRPLRLPPAFPVPLPPPPMTRRTPTFVRHRSSASSPVNTAWISPN